MKLVRTLLTLLQSPAGPPPEPPPLEPSLGGGAWTFPQFQPAPTRLRIRARVQRRAVIRAAAAPPAASCRIRASRRLAVTGLVVRHLPPPQFARVRARRPLAVRHLNVVVDVAQQLDRARREDQHLVGFLLGEASRRLEPWNPGTRTRRPAARLQ